MRYRGWPAALWFSVGFCLNRPTGRFLSLKPWRIEKGSMEQWVSSILLMSSKDTCCPHRYYKNLWKESPYYCTSQRQTKQSAPCWYKMWMAYSIPVYYVGWVLKDVETSICHLKKGSMLWWKPLRSWFLTFRPTTSMFSWTNPRQMSSGAQPHLGGWSSGR